MNVKKKARAYFGKQNQMCEFPENSFGMLQVVLGKPKQAALRKGFGLPNLRLDIKEAKCKLMSSSPTPYLTQH